MNNVFLCVCSYLSSAPFTEVLIIIRHIVSSMFVCTLSSASVRCAFYAPTSDNGKVFRRIREYKVLVVTRQREIERESEQAKGFDCNEG